MKITDSQGVRQTQALKRRSGASGASGANFEGFLDALGGAGGASESATVAESSGIGSIDSMLALQSVPEDEVRRKAALREGHTMLDALEGLRGALLTGRIPPDVIRELDARLSRQRQHVTDPNLLEIIDDIELRVAVEKAKLEMAITRGWEA